MKYLKKITRKMIEHLFFDDPCDICIVSPICADECNEYVQYHQNRLKKIRKMRKWAGPFSLFGGVLCVLSIVSLSTKFSGILISVFLPPDAVNMVVFFGFILIFLFTAFVDVMVLIQMEYEQIDIIMDISYSKIKPDGIII